VSTASLVADIVTSFKTHGRIVIVGASLAGLRGAPPDPARLPSLGGRLRRFLGPLGWAPVDQVIDLIAFVLTAWALGFHLLLLPTFIAEFFPVVDMLPTWTACVIAVIALRKREQRAVPPQLKDGQE